MNKQKVLTILSLALSFEEITLIPSLTEFLMRVWKSELDEMVKWEATEKTRHILDETVEHSRMLSEMIREVTRSGRDEY